MVSSAFHPLNIYIVGLGGAFLIPLLYRFGRRWLPAVFVLALAAMTLISGVSLWRLARGGMPIDILTGGARPPYSIDLRMGLPEAIFAFSINLVALLGAGAFARGTYGAMLLCLLLVMGIQGMVMTRDMFNLFVFLEIVSVATYGLLSLQDTPAALSATFKYLMATVLASTFFLIGTVLLYAVTGILNIDDLILARETIAGPIGFAALMFLLACLLLELKPFPANGWGLDVYETARGDVAALIAGGVSAGVFFALLKLLPLFDDQLELIAALSAVTFLFSNLIGLQQTKARRLLGYSSIGQMGLMILAACLLQKLQAGSSILYLVIVGLFLNHLFAKAGLFWLAGQVNGNRLLVTAFRKTRSNPPVWHPAGRDLGISTIPGFLGEVATGPQPCGWRALCLDRDCARRLAARSRLSVSLVWPNRPFARHGRQVATRDGWSSASILAGRAADRQRLSCGDRRRSRLAMGICATGCGSRTLSARAVGRACDRRNRAGCGIGWRLLAHSRSVWHQRTIRGSSARGWPRRVDRLPRTA
jgi:NADH:ubiquinone oxidoreductase subunit 2 (subunit N)